MKNHLIHLISFGLIFLTLHPNETFADNTESKQILGSWFTESNEAKIEIYEKKNAFYGKIIWSKKIESGEEKDLDINNSDKSLRDRQIIGLEILSSFEYVGNNKWKNGKIYDPESGKTYSCVLTFDKKKNSLKVRGYLGISLIGRTSIWIKAA